MNPQIDKLLLAAMDELIYNFHKHPTQEILDSINENRAKFECWNVWIQLIKILRPELTTPTFIPVAVPTTLKTIAMTYTITGNDTTLGIITDEAYKNGVEALKILKTLHHFGSAHVDKALLGEDTNRLIMNAEDAVSEQEIDLL